ncbi:hypothetical protein [Methanoculleus chikugoensis]|uniref:hypothetical protein n=1 Tax=Methanoculleus chikugoensis TaxID=118126 RepID=UPI001FB5410F|nr:hypothetical protein [Methanoculleus chikugoensis]
MAIVSGMCTASFADVERETGVPVYRGPRHAADLVPVLSVLETAPPSQRPFPPTSSSRRPGARRPAGGWRCGKRKRSRTSSSAA